jgi:phage minor structural protein
MTLKCYSPGNKPLGFLHNVFDLKITKEIGGMEELTFFIPANSPEAQMVQLEGYIVPEGEQIFVIRELNTHGKDVEVYCMLAIETLYGYCWSEIAKQKVNLVEAFEYVLKYTGWKFVNRTSTPARTRDIYIQNQTVWEALKVLCEVYFIEMTVDTHTHTITAYDSVGQDNGVFFISDMNLVNFRKDTNTHKLITRLIPIGKDGLNITSVNGGKDYIDNNTYSDKLLYGLWMQSAYTNPTQLKEDATKWLAEYAKPYITYNIDIIDLYRLNGNQLFKFNVGDGVTIFDKVTEEKVSQRVVKIEIYPQDPTRNTLELSNKGKTFSDYFQMIQLMQNMANHFIQTNGSATGTGGTNGSSNPNLKDDSISGDHIQSDSISTGHIQANSITTDKLVANSITTDKLTANSVTTDKLTANSITSDKIQANSIKTEHLQANIIDANKIHAGAITTDKLQAGSVTADKIASNSISTDKLQANSITSDKIQANNIEAKHIKANAITADKIGAGAIETDHLQAGVVDSIHIKSDSITAEHLQAGSIVAGSTVIANGAIGDAQISNVNANKINAGEIDTSKVKVKGSNGYLFIENNTLFVVDNKKQIRCELGVIENNSNYGFIVRGSDGKTILIDHNGVHNAGITDGAIDNRKVSENANISGKKLDIDSVIRTINDDGSVNIEGTKIQVGNTTLDVELSKQTNLINDHTTQLSNQQSSIKANTDAIKLKVDSQTYTQDKNTMTSNISKNTSAIEILEKEIDLKVSATDVEEIVGDITTTKINEAVSQINVTTNAISQKVSNVETVTNTLDGKIKSHETRIANAESKVTDSAITNVVKQAQFIKDIEGNITEVESAISSVEQTANSITSKVNGLDGKYTEIKQTVDGIDLTGKVSFSDLSTAGKTTINGANITTGTLSADRVLGGTLKGVSLQTYSGTNTTGVRIHPGGMQLNDTSFFYNNEGKFELQCKQGVAFSSQKDIHIMPGLLASGTPSGSGTVVIPSATLRTQKLYVVNNATFESGLTTSNLLSNGVIYGRNNITLNRGSIYIPRLNSNITADYLRLGGAYISGADSGAIHFNYSSSRSGAIGRSGLPLPSAGGTVTTDHLAFHAGIVACVDSGNFHFITASGGNSTIYPRGVVATYSLDNVARTRTTSKALDIISSVPVTQTVEGFRLDVPKARTTENEQLITTSENEQTGELDISTNYNSMLGTMWKAIQELQQEVKELKKENEELRTLLNKGE